MKKRVISFLLALAMVVSLLPGAAFAAEIVSSGTCGENVTWTLTDDGVLTISGTGAMREYYSSGMIGFDMYPQAPWFSYRTQIKEVIVGAGVTSIGSYAFDNCSSLASVTIPNSVTSIDDHAFLYCISLTSVTIPDGVTSIGSYAFSGCYRLTSVTIPASVTSIGIAPFGSCSLSAVYITDLAAWCGISNDSALLFEGAALYLNGCKVTNLVIPEGITSIGYGIFSDCSSLTSVTIPASVTSIGSYAFSDCRSLTSVTIPDSVTSIGARAFDDCTSLTSVTIPASVTSIGLYAFEDCYRLKKIHFMGDAPDITLALSGIHATAYYPAGNPTWTNEVMQDYGGRVTWVPVWEGHTSVIVPGKAATCTETGLTDGVKCSACGEILTAQQVIPAGHTEVTIPGKAATCTETGLTDGKKCTVCGVTTVAQQTIPAKGHSETTIPGKAATCTETGLTDGVKCSACHEILTSQETIPAAGHNYADGVCTDCGAQDPNFKPAGLIGDADGSGEVDYLDAMIVLQYHTGIAGDDTLNLAVCDVDGSGEVDYLDAMLLLQYHTGVIPEL